MIRLLKNFKTSGIFLSCMLLSAVTCANQTQADLSAEQRQQLRIVALAPHIVESLFAIGAGEQIIATTAHADYPEAAKAIPVLGNYARLQIEKVVQLQPDVIIAWQNGNPSDDLARLQKYKLNIVYSQPKNLADVAAELIMLGKVTGRETKANALAEDYLSRLNALKQRYAKAEPVSVFYELWSRPLRTVANNAWPQQQVALCGGVNPFAKAEDEYPQVGLEQVFITQPQIVIQPTMNKTISSDALDWSQWPDVPASANGFILHPDSDKVHRMTVRMLDEVTLMCEQMDAARGFYTQQSGS
ncbi:cobalamin-binding protein [Alteromonadaceae bacterium BrNp21-10]|nr:cobalamin-binding protein [Alteromonadaceae bacterium BrNp21-10]